MVAMNDKKLSSEGSKFKFTHCEIHPSMVFGATMFIMPFIEHNLSSRNAIGTSQCRQGIGIYISNYYILLY